MRLSFSVTFPMIGVVGFLVPTLFIEKKNKFEGYSEEVKYISFTCGGCCGKKLAAKLENFSKYIRREEEITKDHVVVHLAPCIVTENNHSDRCPHTEYIKDIVSKKGYNNMVEGSYTSKNAAKKREKGIYKTY